jgi:DNA polymerase V
MSIVKMKIEKIISVKNEGFCGITAFEKPASAGALIPTENKIDEMIDINEMLIDHPADTFFSKVQAEFEFAGISNGDIAIIDNAVKPESGDIVCVVEGDGLSLCEYIENRAGYFLKTDKGEIKEIEYPTCPGSKIAGVVSRVIHSL